MISKYICIREFEGNTSVNYNKCYNVELVDLSHIGREKIYRIYDDNVYIKTIYDINTLKDNFIEYGIWKALCRNKQINSILQD